MDTPTTQTPQVPPSFAQSNRKILRLVFLFLAMLFILCMLCFSCAVLFNKWQDGNMRRKVDIINQRVKENSKGYTPDE